MGNYRTNITSVCFPQLLVTDVMSQPLTSASVLAESAVAMASKSVVLSHAAFTLNEYVMFGCLSVSVISSSSLSRSRYTVRGTRE